MRYSAFTLGERNSAAAARSPRPALRGPLSAARSPRPALRGPLSAARVKLSRIIFGGFLRRSLWLFASFPLSPLLAKSQRANNRHCSHGRQYSGRKYWRPCEQSNVGHNRHRCKGNLKIFPYRIDARLTYRSNLTIAIVATVASKNSV